MVVQPGGILRGCPVDSCPGIWIAKEMAELEIQVGNDPEGRTATSR